MKISQITALEVLDSRGKPTVRTFLKLEDGSVHSSSVPSGASTGSHEAVEMRDKDEKRFGGQGVLNAVKNVNTTIASALKGVEVSDPKMIDKKMLELDGTENKSKLGANAILSVSQAVVRAAAYAQKKPLWKFINECFFNDVSPSFPRLMVNVVNGGKHAGWNFDIQEFMVVPTSNTPSKSVREAAEIFHQLGAILKKKSMSTLVGDEGGYSPSLSSNEEVIETIIQAGSDLGYADKDDFNIALDAAASEFYKENNYIFKKTNQTLTGDELLEYYATLQEKYFIISFEDPFFEDDWNHFTKFTEKVGSSSLVVGDDLFTTNTKRLQKGIDEKAGNAILIKLNQIGTVLETAEAINLARSAGLKHIISHRSGETEDSFIADLAYGSAADFIKTGSMSRSERLCKYNRLLEIENNL